MLILTADQARDGLLCLINDIAASHQPVFIAGKRNSAVLIAKEDWSDIQKILFQNRTSMQRKMTRKNTRTSAIKGNT